MMRIISEKILPKTGISNVAMRNVNQTFEGCVLFMQSKEKNWHRAEAIIANRHKNTIGYFLFLS